MKWNCYTRAPWPWNKALLMWLLNVHYIQMRFPSAVGGASLFSSGMMCVWKRLGMKLQSGGCRVQIGDVFFAHMTSHCPHSRLQLLQTSCHLYYYSKLHETVLYDRARNGWNWNSSWKQWSTNEEKQLCCCLRFVERLQCVGLSSAHCLCACVCGVNVRGVPSPPPPSSCVSVCFLFWRTSATGLVPDTEQLWQLLWWRCHTVTSFFYCYYALCVDDEDTYENSMKANNGKHQTSLTLTTTNCSEQNI